MDIPFFYEAFNESDEIHLSEANIHHMLHVLRMKVGESLWLTNGKGTKCMCNILSVTKKDCQIKVLEFFTEEKRKAHLHLAIAFTKNPSRMEWLLEKATEMGIEEITPMITARSEKIFLKRERFEKIIQSAMLQSKQCFLPILNEPQSLHNILGLDAEIKLIAHCEEVSEKKKLLQCSLQEKNAIVLIGPEGDFTPDEISQALMQHFIPVSLGDTRLRTETAGLFACAMFNGMQ